MEVVAGATASLTRCVVAGWWQSRRYWRQGFALLAGVHGPTLCIPIKSMLQHCVHSVYLAVA